ncbi:MAG: SDR family NAD(P)-dependent oxidoreductase [Acidimicrobiales bacterium]|jgi:citronellol/citronellal dehydrogenase
MEPQQSLSGKVALVTGASRGIGEAIARRFAAEGAAVGVTARTVEDGDHPLAGSINSTVRAISDTGGIAIAIAADLARAEDRGRVVQTVHDELGPVDILVNNAAVTYFVPVADFDLHRYQLMFDVQVLGPFHLAQLVIPEMRAAGAGWILNVSSPAAIHPKGPPYPPAGGGTVYGMCKAALERFTTGLASELYPDGIAVNVLSPTGLVVTPGVVHHQLDKRVPVERHEPVGFMAEAALVLCTGDPLVLTGRVTYSQALLNEFGVEPVS